MVYPTIGIDGKRYEKIGIDAKRYRKIGKDGERWQLYWRMLSSCDVANTHILLNCRFPYLERLCNFR